MKFLFIVATFFFVICSCTPENKTLKIAVASNMEIVFQEIAKEFKKENQSVKLDIIATSSGKLFTQIVNGAPFDIFISADFEYPKKLLKEKKVVGNVVEYAQGTLILWTKKDLKISKIDFLTSKYSKIAIANPETAPYGAAAIEYLKKNKVYDKIKSKLVFAESIGQVNHFVESQVADFGFTSSSVVAGKKENWIEINKNDYSTIRQGMCQLIHSKNNGAAKDLVDFMQSEKAKKIPIEFGYKIK